MIKPSIDAEFTKCFEKIFDDKLDKNSIKYFCPLIDSNDFNYDSIIEKLIDYMPHYCLSRSTYNAYKNRPAWLSKIARNKFMESNKNKGELAELMSFSFLESDLRAPKIISKMEIKQDNNIYVHGSDGVHILKTNSGYELIFAEAKSYTNLYEAIKKAIKDIYDFKNKPKDNNSKETGINFEKGLISSGINKEVSSPEEEKIILDVVFPRRNSGISVNTSFAVVILYDPNLDKNLKSLSHDEYRVKVHFELEQQIKSRTDDIKSLIIQHDLHGHNFYFYIVPISNLQEKRQEILDEVIS